MTDGGMQLTRVRILRRHVVTDAARDRIARALYEAVVDGFEFGASEVASPADREWLRGAFAVALHDTVDVALDLMASRIATALDDAPNGLGERYDRSHRWEEYGGD